MVPPRPPARRASSIEWPTLLLAIVIHSAWMAVTWWHASLPWYALVVAGGWLIAWHGSLQHETIHGHPTNRAWINACLGGMPLSLWLPYGHYRRTHLTHHRIHAVTDPLHDPESRYLTERQGFTGALLRFGARLESSLLGRMIVGPAFAIGRFLHSELSALRREPRRIARDWLPHAIALCVVLAWLSFCRFGLLEYLLLVVYPGTALSLLRSFAEHRADPRPGHRVAVVERAGVFALLFLNNNLHAAHHRSPALAWYRLPAYYRTYRHAILARNGGLVYQGYQDVARRFLFRAHDVPVHPDHVGRAAIT